MATNHALMTAEELFKRPRDNFRHELVRGELITMAPAGIEHGAISADLAAILRNHVKANKLGHVFIAEAGFLIARDPDTVRAPDASFVRRERIPATGLPKGYWPGPPDLAVEVVSPNDRTSEVDEKVGEWLAAGTLLVWVVSPDRRTVTVHRPAQPSRVLSEDATLDGEDVVPGFRCPVREIFPDVAPGT